MIECKSLAAKWEQLSTYLGLSCDVIDNIKGSGDNYHCWSEALKHWIRQNYNTDTFGRPSWRSLLKAVAEVDKRLFESLAVKHSQTVMVLDGRFTVAVYRLVPRLGEGGEKPWYPLHAHACATFSI